MTPSFAVGVAMLCGASASAADSGVPAAPPIRVAITDIRLDGVDDRVGRIFIDSLTDEVRKLRRVAAMSLGDVRAMLDLEAQRQMAGCADDTSCMSEISDALGADAMVIGSVSRVGSQIVLSLKRLDRAQAKAVASWSQRIVVDDGTEVLAAVGPAVEALFPEYELREGMQRGVADEVVLRLNPPPIPPLVFWAAAGVTGALVGTSVFATGAWGFVQADFHTFQNPNGGGAVDGVTLLGRRDLVVNTYVAMWTLWGAAGLAGVATAVLVPFTDFAGYAADE